MKILLIQLSGAGDVLQTTLLLRCLKKNLPDADVHLLVQQHHADLVATNPYIDSLHRLHFNQQTTLHELIPQHFDVVMDLQPTPESALFQTQLAPPKPVAKQKGFKTFLARLWKGSAAALPKAEAYLHKAETLNVTHDGGGLDFLILAAANVPFSDIPAAHHAGFIAIALQPSPHFQWPPSLLQQLCTIIQHPIILLGSEKEAPLAQTLSAIDSIKIYNACGKFSPYETADLVRKAKLLVAFQPYFLQLAAAFSKPLVMLAPTGKEDAPYYSPRFLKSSPTFPYDRLTLPKTLLATATVNSDPKWQAAIEKMAEEMKMKITQRLRGGA